MNLLGRASKLAISPLPAPTGWYAIPLRLIVGFGFIQHGYAKLARGPDDFINILHAITFSPPLLVPYSPAFFPYSTSPGGRLLRYCRHRSTIRRIRCPCRRNVSVQLCGRYPKAVGDLHHANIGIGEQCPRGLKIIIGQFRWSAAGTALSLSGGKSRAGALADQAAFELRQGAEHMKHQQPLRGCGVDELGQAAKPYLSQAKLLNGLDQLLHGSR